MHPHNGPELTPDKPKPLKGDIKFGVGLQAQKGDLMSFLFVPWPGQHPSEWCSNRVAFVFPMHTTMPGSPCRVLWLKFIAKFIEKLMRKAAKYWLWEENTTHLEWGGKCSNNLATIDLALSMYWSSFYNINLHLQSAAKGTDFILWPR